MALSKAQKQKLAKDGFKAADIKAIEANLADADEDEPKSRRSRSDDDGGQVAILRGTAADRFLKAFGLAKDDDEDEDEPKSRRRSRDADDDEDEDDDDDDEDAPRKTRWFG